MIPEFVSAFNKESGALIAEELFFPRTEIRLINNYLNYPKPINSMRGALIYKVWWEQLYSQRIKSKLLFELDEPLSFNFSNWKELLAEIEMLLIFL